MLKFAKFRVKFKKSGIETLLWSLRPYASLLVDWEFHPRYTSVLWNVILSTGLVLNAVLNAKDMQNGAIDYIPRWN